MIEILQFLKILQRIVIFLVILGFAPLAAYVFSANSLNISDDLQRSFQTLYDQANSGFVLDLRKNCTLQDAIVSNTYCFEYCSMKQDCSIIDPSKACQAGSFQYYNFQRRYCALKSIKNSIQTNTTNITIQSNYSMPPIYSLQPNKTIYYVYNGNTQDENCQTLLNLYQGNIRNAQKVQSSSYLMTLKYLFYTLIPIYVFTLLSTIIETFTKFDYKRIMQITLFNTCIISIALIIIGIIFDYRSTQLEDRLKWVGKNCVIDSAQAYSIRLNLSQDLTNGIPIFFTILMGVVGVLEGFLIVFLIILWIIEIKMHKLRKEDTSSGYELHSI